jgi:SAM-dependent methyltransferase
MRPPPLTFNAWLRWDIVQRRLSELESVGSVLEVGAGEGALGSRLAGEYDYTGVEPDERSCKRAQARLAAIGRGRAVCGDLSSLERGESFDLVCAFEVLEHIEDDAAALSEWRERLRPGGHLLLSVPAYQGQWGAGDVKAGHFRRYEPHGLQTTLRDAGFEVVAIDHYGFPLGNLLQAGRNLIARREAPPESVAAASAGSGRWLQPPEALEWATQAFTWPFRQLQRPFIRRPLGTGLVALARRASERTGR